MVLSSIIVDREIHILMIAAWNGDGADLQVLTIPHGAALLLAVWPDRGQLGHAGGGLQPQAPRRRQHGARRHHRPGRHPAGQPRGRLRLGRRVSHVILGIEDRYRILLANPEAEFNSDDGWAMWSWVLKIDTESCWPTPRQNSTRTTGEPCDLGYWR